MRGGNKRRLCLSPAAAALRDLPVQLFGTSLHCLEHVDRKFEKDTTRLWRERESVEYTEGVTDEG